MKEKRKIEVKWSKSDLMKLIVKLTKNKCLRTALYDYIKEKDEINLYEFIGIVDAVKEDCGILVEEVRKRVKEEIDKLSYEELLEIVELLDN